MPEGGYRKALGVTIPPPPPALSNPPSGAVVVQGAGWKFTAPMMVVTAILGAVGARAIPTPTQETSALQELRTAQQLEALQNERFRNEVRSELEAQRRARDLELGELRNRLTGIEAGFAYWRKNGPLPAPAEAPINR